MNKRRNRKKRMPNHIYIRRWVCCAVLLLILSYALTLLFNLSINANKDLSQSPSNDINSPSDTPENQTEPTEIQTNQPAPTATPVAELPFNLTLVNNKVSVDRSYAPEDLINVYTIYGNDIVPLAGNDVLMNEEAFLACQEMFSAAKSQGIRWTYIVSAYRDYAKQESLYNDYVAEGGLNDEYARVAKPGDSEHHTGLAMDLGVMSENIQVTEAFENTDQGKWYIANCWQYGFIVRYPSDKKGITGITYEPWHFRYVGVEHSLKMKSLNLCLEEYVEYLNNN